MLHQGYLFVFVNVSKHYRAKRTILIFAFNMRNIQQNARVAE